ncbi:MAG: glycerol-3-phosphate 1-O-acyltransferase PlsY [Verrucomicrobia bacterium]|nr:glycerol-3-phosphate 1-O-acyltransferase PlsY [Verrucomicrobiota bacterium]
MEVAGCIIVALAAYLLGSIPSGYLAGRAKGIDIRTVGSGNIGATNVFRILGKTAGVLVMLADMAKGWLACWGLAEAGLHFFGSQASDPDSALVRFRIIAGIAAILGHNYTCWLKFKGGKGVATTAGVLLALFPQAFLIGLGVWGLVLALSRYVSLASITAALSLPFAVWFCRGGPTLIGVAALLGALAIYKHKSNMQRLWHGTELRLGRKKTEEK